MFCELPPRCCYQGDFCSRVFVLEFSGLFFVIVRIVVCEAFDQEGVKFFHHIAQESSTGAQRGRRLFSIKLR